MQIVYPAPDGTLLPAPQTRDELPSKPVKDALGGVPPERRPVGWIHIQMKV